MRSETTTAVEIRVPRRDAAINRERLLAAAAVAVKREGEKVPLATIAEDAGVGVATLYRHYPTRETLLAALSHRSFVLVLELARRVAGAEKPGIESIRDFLEQTIAHRDDLILPLHGGPVFLDQETASLRAEIRVHLTAVLRRGQRDGTVKSDVTAEDIIITGAMISQPLAHAADWDRIARRQARIYIDGLAPS